MKKDKVIKHLFFLIIVQLVNIQCIYSQNSNDQTSLYFSKVFDVEKEYIELQNRMISLGFLNTLTFKYNDNWVTYGAVNVRGKFWLDRNLGAKRVALHMEDKASFGDYFQWGRQDDGHQLLDSIVYDKYVLPHSQPNHNFFIMSIDGRPTSDWTLDRSWGYRWIDKKGIKTASDVCPQGWHVPKTIEWAEIASNFKNDTALFHSKLKIVKAGCNISYKSNVEKYGFYWSANFDMIAGCIVGRAYYFNHEVSDAWRFSQPPMRGFPIRCTKDSNEPQK